MLYQYISTPMTSIPCPPASSMMKEGMVPDKAEHAKLQEQHTVKKLTKENKKKTLDGLDDRMGNVTEKTSNIQASTHSLPLAQTPVTCQSRPVLLQ